MTPNCIKNILHSCRSVAIGAAIALTLLTGCRDDSYVPDLPGVVDPVEVEKGRITLDLSIGINNGGNTPTRAFDLNDDESFEDPISEYEKVHTLRVVIVRHKVQKDASGNVIATEYLIEHNRMVNVNEAYSNGSSNLVNGYYVINDNLQFKVVADEMKTIYLFANENGVNLNKSADKKFDFTNELAVGKPFPTEKVENLLITRQPKAPFIDNGATTPLADKLYIPMSESFNVLVPPSTGKVEDKYSKSLFLTRSLIKFSFSVTLEGNKSLEEIKNLKLVGVKISNLADASYYLPRDTEYDPKKYFGVENSGGEDDYFDLGVISQSTGNPDRKIISFSVPEQSGFSDCTFMFAEPLEIKKDGQNTFYPKIYLPESKSEDGYMLSLLFDSEEWNDLYEAKPLKFRLNDIENTKDIPRNTHVKVNISLTTHSMEATVTLFPYTAVWLNPEFGFIIPVDGVSILMFTTTDEDGNWITEAVTEHSCVVGDSFDLIGSVSPEDATNKTLTWTSSDPTVATVDPTGRVTALKQPDDPTKPVYITATSVANPEKSAQCKVTINSKVSVTGITLSPPSGPLNIGETVTLTATVSPPNATHKEIIWESSEPTVATVSSLGMVTALSAGTTIITAKAADDDTKTATCVVRVNDPIPVTGVTITNNISGTFYVGNQFSFTASVTPTNATNQGIYWSLDPPDSDIVTVTDYGLVTAVKPGTVDIIAQSTDNSMARATRRVTVTQKVDVTGVIISSTDGGSAISDLTLPGSARRVYGRVTPANATYKGLIWRSNDASIVSVGINGSTLTPYKKGSTTITVTSADNPEKFATLNVTATADVNVTGVSITSGGNPMPPQTIKVGESVYMRGAITPSNATYLGTIWESSDPTVATLEKYSTATTYVYEAIGRSAGETTITVTPMDNPNVKATLKITVVPVVP